MALLIKDPETDRIVRELAARTGESLTEAVKVAARQRLDRLPRAAGVVLTASRLRRPKPISTHCPA